MYLFCAYLGFIFLPTTSAAKESSADVRNQTTEECQGLLNSYWTQLHGKKCYTLRTDFRTWEAAEMECNLTGGHLMKMETREIGLVIFNWSLYFHNYEDTVDPEPYQVWIGARDYGDGKFVWWDGTVVQEAWWYEHDVNFGKVKDFFKTRILCATLKVMSNQAYWEKEECDYEYNFVCEHATYRETVLTEDITKKTAVMCQGLLNSYWTQLYGERCYTLHEDLRTWEAAQNECVDGGGHLMKMETRDLGPAIFNWPLYFHNYNDTMNLKPYQVWIGAREDGHGNFQWWDGTVVQEAWWYEHDVNFGKVKDFFKTRILCATLKVMSNQAYWEKEECDYEYNFVCEHATFMSTTTKPDPERVVSDPVSQRLLSGVKRVNGVFNPKLKAEPDDTLVGKSLIVCARICTDNESCKLFNHFSPVTCALYFDEKRALSEGADSVSGSKVWKVR